MIREKRLGGRSCKKVCSLQLGGRLGGELDCKKSKKDEEVCMSEEQRRSVCKMGQEGEHILQHEGQVCMFRLLGWLQGVHQME